MEGGVPAKISLIESIIIYEIFKYTMFASGLWRLSRPSRRKVILFSLPLMWRRWQVKKKRTREKRLRMPWSGERSRATTWIVQLADTSAQGIITQIYTGCFRTRRKEVDRNLSRKMVTRLFFFVHRFTDYVNDFIIRMLQCCSGSIEKLCAHQHKNCTLYTSITRDARTSDDESTCR